MVADTSPLPLTPSNFKAVTAQAEAQHDVILVRRFLDGDQSAFIEIADRYRSKLFNLAFGHIRNRSDAEEIAQETLIRAHRGLVRFRGDSSLSTWLHRITLNLARNRYWYYFRRRRHLSLSLDTPLRDSSPATFADLMATEDVGPVREIASQEFSELVTLCLARLPASARGILVLRIMQDLSYNEIAQKMDLNIGTVKSRIARARANLRQLMIEACPEFGPEAAPLSWFAPMLPSGGLQVAVA